MPKRLDGFHIMIVSKYFDQIHDFFTLETVCRKFMGNITKFHFNPIPLTPKTLKYFPRIETLNIWSKNEEAFMNKVWDDSLVTPNISKVNFFRVVIWYEVDYKTSVIKKSLNFVFKNIVYGEGDRLKYGDVVPPGVATVGEDAYYGHVTLDNIKIPESVSELGECCFSNCSNLREIELPNSVIVLCGFCFQNCYKLKDIRLPLNITSIEESCFEHCALLEEIRIPSGVSKLKKKCFYGCSKLNLIEMSNCVTYIGNECFKMCRNLSSITLPANLKDLQLNTIFECDKLDKIEFFCE
ncbi:hypothetical protein EIN_272040 [Entamoeba invadens IP1]|uniref:Leucine rich repeat containing protein BspA family protein n=1 Tax=Entamoeba invadens IP1 TaxID=370355 RepID=A0A0A1UC66_ENTIV|nr:hypothetical protein EIN_272040 [Entamoeba invadens IP1]ELP89859.1 hypothetical protein EIN_272040 [Entamoeba invadens IP1]|eukprot:XP_004256630.1 hypothetical protein EIN_272040 [Entamoeba invadens IP1]